MNNTISTVTPWNRNTIGVATVLDVHRRIIIITKTTVIFLLKKFSISSLDIQVKNRLVPRKVNADGSFVRLQAEILDPIDASNNTVHFTSPRIQLEILLKVSVKASMSMNDQLLSSFVHSVV